MKKMKGRVGREEKWREGESEKKIKVNEEIMEKESLAASVVLISLLRLVFDTENRGDLFPRNVSRSPPPELGDRPLHPYRSTTEA
jgi:hypothetical protein